MENVITRPRWTVVIGAVMIQVCLGAVYTWSLFNQPLIEKFGWSRDAIVLTFSITIGMFALSTVFAGRIQDKIGPRKVAIGGALLVGIGFCLSSYATELWHLYILYGVIGGTGIGTAYVTPLATCVKWYPDKRGTISGIAVVGMGLGGMIFKPVIVALLDNVGVSNTFLYLGLIYMAVIFAGAQLLRLPPEGYKPEGWVPSETSKAQKEDFMVLQTLATSQFYILWVMYMFGCTAGLMVIGIAKDLGLEYANLSAATAANIVVSIAFANAVGRLFWGAVSDRIGRLNALASKYLLTASVLAFLAFGPMNVFTFYMTLSLIGFCFGGFLAVYPTVAADFYGTKNLGMNYGLLYLAYGVAAFVGPALTSFMTIEHAFVFVSLATLIAGIIAFFIKHPIHPTKKLNYV
jgi:OFA family oxalate/formate antiporter-like MFS transporter